MFQITLVLVLQYVAFSEPILVERFCQDFIKINFPLSASCKKSANFTQNLGNCFQSCLIYNGSSYMVSRNADTTECVCCQDVPSEDVYSSGNWNTYSFACPVGYTEVRSHTTRTCLRFISSTVDYPTAASDCQQHNGDLVKIDRPRMMDIFLEFLFNYTSADERVDDSVWIQGQEDINSVWRFDDGSKMPGFYNLTWLKQMAQMKTDFDTVFHMRSFLTVAQLFPIATCVNTDFYKFGFSPKFHRR